MHTNANANGIANSHVDGDSNCNGDRHGDCDLHAYTYSDGYSNRNSYAYVNTDTDLPRWDLEYGCSAASCERWTDGGRFERSFVRSWWVELDLRNLQQPELL